MSGLVISSQPKLNILQTKGRFENQVKIYRNENLLITFIIQVVIVTGGAGGIGGAIVHRFASDGAKVAILDRNQEAATSKMQELEDAGIDTKTRVKFFQIDVTSRDMCHEVVAQVVNMFGAVHHLVNCVAYFGSESLSATEKDWDTTMRFDYCLFIISQGLRAGRGFNELYQEVRHHQGGWGHFLDHPPCSDKSQNSGFLRKSIFLILGDP